MSEILNVILSAGVGVVVALLTTSWKTRKDLESQYDIDLRKLRLDAYAELWRTLEPLAMHFPARELDVAGAEQLGRALRRWYYASGGLVLSEDSRAPYFNLQGALEGVQQSKELDDSDRKVLKALGSRLRTSTTRDVATRVRPRLSPSRLRPTVRRLTKPVSLVVDRRWIWDREGRRPGVFVIVRNLTRRPLTVTSIGVDGVDPVSPHFVLQRNEQHEFEIPLRDGADVGVAPSATVVLGGRRRVRRGSVPPVPLRSDLIATSAKAAISEKS